MDWRREDSGYAAAALGAVGFLAYLLAANFGLVPSPIGPLGGPSPVDAAIAITPGGAAPPSDVPAVAPTPGSDVPAVGRPTAPRRDAGRPTLAFVTQDGATFGVAEPAVVSGTAADAASGIDDVFVTFATGSQRTTRPAATSCADATRRSCRWSAEVPAVLADYTVTARATDRAGNRGEPKQIGVTVVNSGGVVDQVGGAVRRVPGLLDRLVDGLFGGDD